MALCIKVIWVALQSVFKGVVYLAFTPLATMIQLPTIVVYCSNTMAKPFDPPMHHDTTIICTHLYFAWPTSK